MITPYPSTSTNEKLDSQSRGVHDSGEGDLAPRLVIRGESIQTPHTGKETTNSNSLSLIDYLGFTYFPRELAEEVIQQEEFPLKDLLTYVFNIPCRDWVRTKAGWQGYDSKIKLDVYGLVAFGGVSQNGSIHVELYGGGCAQVKDWTLVYDWFVTTDSRITRIDLAHDDFLGKSINIEKAIGWYEDGLFNSTGRPPSRRLIDDFDSGDGKTLYIGKRGNGQYTRVYEKGKESGEPSSPWCRAEVEFKPSTKPISLDVLIDSDRYLAGAYPAFAFLSVEQSRFATQQKEKEISLQKTKEWARSTCGQLINLLCLLSGENHKEVIAELRRPGIPEKFVPLLKRQLSDEGLLP
jgi:phage replication initiation protein